MNFRLNFPIRACVSDNSIQSRSNYEIIHNLSLNRVIIKAFEIKKTYPESKNCRRTFLYIHEFSLTFFNKCLFSHNSFWLIINFENIYRSPLSHTMCKVFSKKNSILVERVCAHTFIFYKFSRSMPAFRDDASGCKWFWNYSLFSSEPHNLWSFYKKL